jgi:hypothetical protein
MVLGGEFSENGNSMLYTLLEKKEIISLIPNTKILSDLEILG